MLGWTATPASTAFLATLDWYRAALTEFPVERDTVLGELLQTVVSLQQSRSFLFPSRHGLQVPRANRDAVYLAIDRELGRAGRSEEKFSRKKKGELGSPPRPTTKNEELKLPKEEL